MPGTPRNKNALRHGKRSYLVTGTLMPGTLRITRRLCNLTNALHQAVEAKYGSVSLTRAAIIQSATRAEMVASLAKNG